MPHRIRLLCGVGVTLLVAIHLMLAAKLENLQQRTLPQHSTQQASAMQIQIPDSSSPPPSQASNASLSHSKQSVSEKSTRVRLRPKGAPINIVDYQPSPRCSCNSPDACVEPIDVVITWVNGSEPTHQELRKFYQAKREQHWERLDQKNNPGVATRRFRDNGELRFALRSIFFNAPWVRTIFIVTANQTPAWLDTSHPRIKLISHSEIYPNISHLPTFNSLSIELHLHRIPGLSTHYLYLNDDTMFSDYVCPDDFIRRVRANSCESLHIGIRWSTEYTFFVERNIFLESWNLPEDTSDMNLRGATNAHVLLNSLFGGVRRHLPTHTPLLLNKDIVNELQAKFKSAIAQTSAHRFRDDHSIFFNFMYLNYVHEKPWIMHDNATLGQTIHACLTSASHGGLNLTQSEREKKQWRTVLMAPGAYYSFFMLGVTDQKTMLSLAKNKPKFLCINDDITSEENTEYAQQLERLYLRLFPRSAPWEFGNPPVLTSVKKRLPL